MSPADLSTWLRDFCAAASALDADSVTVMLKNARGLVTDIGEFELEHWGLLTAEGVIEWISSADRSTVQTVELTAMKKTGARCGADECWASLMRKESEFPPADPPPPAVAAAGG